MTNTYARSGPRRFAWNPIGRSCLANLYALLCLGVALGSAATATSQVNGPGGRGLGADGQAGLILIGGIESAAVADAQDRWSVGTIKLVCGTNVIIPGNLIIDLPANRMTLQEFCNREPGQQPGACELLSYYVVEILANRQADGRIIAGAVWIDKDDQAHRGVVSAIDADGSFVINDTLRVRINDSEAVHTAQTYVRLPMEGQPNCSPDPRFGVDPSNHTIAGTTGYPFCVNGTNRSPNSGRAQGVREATAGDSTRQEPLMVGDVLTATGNIEYRGTSHEFISAHIVSVATLIATATGDPDYVVVA